MAIPIEVPTGAIRYNTDSNKMECFDGTKWMQVAVSSPDLNGGTRGFHNGGRTTGAYQNVLQYYTISTAGNAVDFGTMVVGGSSNFEMGAFSSKTRGICFGGRPSNTHSNVMEYVTMSSLGNSQNFGDLTDKPTQPSGFSNSTRGVRCGGIKQAGGGSTSYGVNIMDSVTIATIGNAVDFGDMSNGASGGQCSSSSTRGFIMGGMNPHNLSNGASALSTNSIQYVTIATTGNSTDFGDCFIITKVAAQASNATRTVAGGNSYPDTNNGGFLIQQMTNTTLGNSLDFGNLTQARNSMGAAASSTRAVFTGGYRPGYSSVMDYVNFATTGDAVDFGDLNSSNGYNNGFSNGHGGL